MGRNRGPSSVDIANVFLDLADIKKTRLIKLCYIAYGYYLALKDKKGAFSDDIKQGRLFFDRIEAWQYGPVMPLLYAVYDYKTEQGFEFPFCDNKEINKEIKEFIKVIWEAYGEYSAKELIYLTHKKGTPWDRTYDVYDWSKEIEDDIILKYYKDLIKK